MPKILNKYKDDCSGEHVFVGRPSPFGNPFIIGRDGNRNEVCEKYALWIKTQSKLIEKIKGELKGKDLVCFCSPKLCHAETLIKITNGE